LDFWEIRCEVAGEYSGSCTMAGYSLVWGLNHSEGLVFLTFIKSWLCQMCGMGNACGKFHI